MSRALELLTVVYSINDRKAFDSEWKHLHALFLPPSSKDAPFQVIGFSADNEMQRAEMIRKALKLYQNDPQQIVDAVDAILSCAELTHFSFDEFEGGY